MPGEGVLGMLRRRPNGVGKQLWGFGYNSFYLLADCTNVNRSSPVQNFSGGNNWMSISAGKNATAAGVKSDGTLWTWGYNTLGALGINTQGFYTSVSSPIQTIAYGTTWSSVSCGISTVFGTKSDGTLWAWGGNYFGQIGDNTIVHRSSPVQVVGFATTWSSVSGGAAHAAAIKKDGTLWLWGCNTQGQLGDDTVTHRSSPVQIVGGGATWSQVSCGEYHTAAIKTDGTLWCWGANSLGGVNRGCLGDNSVIHRSSPVQTAAFGTNWKQVSCSAYHTSAIKLDGTWWNWGDNSNGNLGDNTITFRSSPVQTTAYGYSWIACSAGTSHTMAIKADYSLWGTGFNNYGSLGTNETNSKSSPVQVIGTGNWYSVSAGQHATLGLRYGDFGPYSPVPVPSYTPQPIPTSNGYMFTWGNNTLGQLGDNTSTHKSSAVQVAASSINWKQASAGNSFSVAIKTDGTLWTWGQNASGQLGDNTIIHRSSPVQTVNFGSTWTQVGAGNIHAGGVKSDGTLWLWGNNTNGRLGDNSITHRSSPVQTDGTATTWIQVFCGDAHTAATKNDATLWCWGKNTDGQLGDNSITHRSSPVQTVAVGTNWKYLSCGSNHTAGLKLDGTLWLWGNNAYGQLGDNSIVHRSSPIQTISYGTSWTRVSCGRNMTIAVKNDGTLWCWGKNTEYELGDNSTTNRSSPVQTLNGGTNWISCMAGYKHTMATNTGNLLFVWGANTYGQIGDNSVLSRSYPICIVFDTLEWQDVFSGPMASHTLATAQYAVSPPPPPTPPVPPSPTPPSPTPPSPPSPPPPSPPSPPSPPPPSPPLSPIAPPTSPAAFAEKDIADLNDKNKFAFYVVANQDNTYDVVCLEIKPGIKCIAGPYLTYEDAKKAKDSITFYIPTPQ